MRAHLSSQRTQESHLYTASGTHPLDLRLANTFLSRLCGLMLRQALAPNQGLLITRCPSVHSLFMRFAIDVIYLDQGGFVTRCTPQLKPWRASTGRSRLSGHTTAHALELRAGSIQALNIAVGNRLYHPLFTQSTRHA
ncbi:MAG: DUF192 domain-containing protein [Burkholderiales bacterium]